MTKATKNQQRLNWKAHSLRLTAFVSPSSETGIDNDLWTPLLGSDPDADIKKPKQQTREAVGSYGNGHLQVATQPTRIDINYLSNPLDEEVEAFPHLGEYETALSLFDSTVRKFFALEDCPALTRLAFGAVLVYPVEAVHEGYTLLAPYLGFSLDFSGASDFLFQINRPRKSQLISGLMLNRLSKWSVGNLWLAPVQMPSSELFQAAKLINYYACRLELDINTTLEYSDEFECEKLPEIWNELLVLGREISEQGATK